MVKVDLEVQFKISVMKNKFENQKHKAQVSNVENKSYCLHKKFWLGLEWGEKKRRVKFLNIQEIREKKIKPHQEFPS